MARRRFRGDEPHMVHEARELASAGLTERSILADLQAQHPEADDRRLRSIVALEVDRRNRLDRLAEVNWGQFTDVPALMGCGPGQTQARVNLEIHWTDPESGESHTFGSTVIVDPGRRVGDLLTNAAVEVARKATEHGYQPSMPARINRDSINTVTVNFIDCA